MGAAVHIGVNLSGLPADDDWEGTVLPSASRRASTKPTTRPRYPAIDVPDRKNLRRMLHLRSSLASAEKEKQFSWPRRPLSAG